MNYIIVVIIIGIILIIGAGYLTMSISYDDNITRIVLAICCILLIFGVYFSGDLFFKKATMVKVIETYELVDENDSNYISVSGGKSRGAYVCYLDDGKYKTYNVGNATILKDDGKSRMEKQKYKWGFLTGTKYVIYLNE
jgi:hypothetical protein